MLTNRLPYCLLLLVIPITVSAQDVDSVESLDKALSAVATFEQGQSSGPLVAIEKFVFTLAPDSPLRGDVEQKLIDALAGAKTADAKRFLCTQLRVVGTAKCVPAVADLLTDAEVAHMSVYCLGRIENDAAGKALHDALGKTTGDIQAGLLNALADRRQAGIAADCVRLLKSENLTVAKAAARALGRLGAYDSALPLRNARAGASEPLQTEINNALLCIAELLAEQGDRRAVEIYREFSAGDFPETLRFAALRGLALTGDSVEQFVSVLITYSEKKQRRFAISLVNLVKGAEATRQIASTVSRLDPDDQVLLLRALGARGDTEAAPVLAAAARSEHEPVRIAALEALGTAGDADALVSLTAAAANDQGLAQKVARASLVKLAGKGIDARLLDLASSGEASARAEAIRALAGRGVNAAVPRLLNSARDSETAVRNAAIEALGTLATAESLPAMVALVVEPTAGEDRSLVAAAIGKLFYRMDDASARSAPVLNAYDTAPATAKVTLLKVLADSGSTQALAKVQSALDSNEPGVREAAVAALAQWPNTDAIAPLLNLVGTTQDSALKEVALKGYVRLAERTADPTKAYLRVLDYVSTSGDRKGVLEGLGINAESTEALAVALKFVDDPSLQAPAGLAALRIAHRLRGSHEQIAREALHRVIAKVDHADVRARAQEVLNDLDKYEDHILQWVATGPYTEKGKDGQAVYNTVFPPEQPGAKDVEWKPITKGIGRWDVNLEATFGGMDYCAAYVRTRVWSPKAQDALLEMGSDDALRIWLNGQLVHENWKMSGAEPRQEKAAVKLAEGWNDLMMKVVDEAGGWVFGVRIRAADGSELEGLKYEAK